jgi:hypothetical protein
MKLGAGIFLGSSRKTGPSPPAFTVDPVIAVNGGGSPTPGASLDLTSLGTWTGDEDTVEAYLFKDGISVAGPLEIGSIANFASEDIGVEFFVRVTITNAAGSDVADSNVIEVVPLTPSNLTPPIISGTGGEVGATVQLDAQGEWDLVDSRSYQWLLDSVEISGQTGTSIDTSGFGPGSYSLVETATNAGGSTPIESNSVSINTP